MTKFDVSPKRSLRDLMPGNLDTSSSEQHVQLPVALGPETPGAPQLPWARGPLSDVVISALRRTPGTLGSTPSVVGVDALRDDDFALALYLCYEVHYREWADANWEWDLGLLGFRAEMERVFLDRLLDVVPSSAPESASDTVAALDDLINSSSGPSLSTYLCETGTVEQLREFCVHRSAYQLKEADPHSFAIARLSGQAKATMMEIQFDEYGSGEAASMHSTLFADTLTSLGLDSTYGSYVEILPAVTLATVNLISMFALRRRWRGALVGHLAVFEMTSVTPMSRYSQALSRLGVGPEGRRFFDVHVQVDERHASLARDRMVASLLDEEPHLGADVLFGAGALLALEDRFARSLLSAWSQDRSSLLSWQTDNP